MSGVFVRDLYFYMESGIKCIIIIIIMSELKSNKKKTVAQLHGQF